MKNLAPIGISTYSRINHLKQTIEALQKNTLAKQSELYIFSDAPKDGDEETVGRVREFIHTVDGFKKVHIIERETNGRVANNRGGIKWLLDKYGKMIFMEDDIVTAPGFLQFINDGLDFYKDDEKILSIGGHTPNLTLLKIMSKDYYITKRFHGWGFGIWESQYKQMEYLPDWKTISKDKILKKQLNEVGNDLWNMVENESLGTVDAADIKFCYLSAKKDLYNILPTQTLVRNIGLDGSGVHCGDDDIHKDDVLSNKVNFTFSEDYGLDDAITKEYKNFYDKPLLYKRVISKIKRISKGQK